ncbi:hypothetical protein ILYODFUR_037597 [Ilyodon furcidens]|uniref:Uncharacterized protein n=1 Tax=Ilyodon furcidens TaxID=33524 RepID=A0ABV0U4U8_9TELE
MVHPNKTFSFWLHFIEDFVAPAAFIHQCSNRKKGRERGNACIKLPSSGLQPGAGVSRTTASISGAPALQQSHAVPPGSCFLINDNLKSVLCFFLKKFFQH